MAQTVTQRLMAVAIEIEDERFAERRRFEQLHEDVTQRLASMQLEKTQAQLAMYRLEEELLEEGEGGPEELRLAVEEHAVPDAAGQ